MTNPQTSPRRGLPGAASRLQLDSAKRLLFATLGTVFGTTLAYELKLVATYGGLAVFGGFDYRTYMAAASRWLAGGPFYEPYQIAGPYQVVAHEILYPPPALLLLAPFTRLPALLWWAIPLVTLAITVAWLRPSAAGWIAILACLSLPMPSGVSWALEYIFNGNPGIWVAMFVGLALRWPLAGTLVLMKPTLAPFALIGIRNRSWWIGLAVVTSAAVLFAPMWPDYVRAIVNARVTTPPFLYSLSNVTLVLIPIFASLSSTRHRSFRAVQ